MRINEIIESIQHISLTESVSRALNEHLNRQVPLCDSIFRYQSDSYFETFRLAKQRRADGNLPDLDWESEELLRTDIGESVNLKGIGQVWLDAPYLDEGCDLLEQFANGDQVRLTEPYAGGSTEVLTLKNWDGEVGWALDQQGRGWRVDAKQIEPVDHQDDHDGWDDEHDSPWDYSQIKEAEYQGKKVELSKPKRGGDKKFYVYVRDPKTKNIRKVSFGAKDGGGSLSVKLNDPKARKAFADRHNCEQKNDKTKPGYWACRLPRYAKSLGLSGGGTWW